MSAPCQTEIKSTGLNSVISLLGDGYSAYWEVTMGYKMTCKNVNCVGAQVPECSWKEESGEVDVKWLAGGYGFGKDALTDECRKAIVGCYGQLSPSNCVKNLKACEGQKRLWSPSNSGSAMEDALASVKIPDCLCIVKAEDRKVFSAQDMRNVNGQIKDYFDKTNKRNLNN